MIGCVGLDELRARRNDDGAAFAPRIHKREKLLCNLPQQRLGHLMKIIASRNRAAGLRGSEDASHEQLGVRFDVRNDTNPVHLRKVGMSSVHDEVVNAPGAVGFG